MRHRFGEHHSANLVGLNLQTRALVASLAEKNWRQMGRALTLGARQVAEFGAESVLLCSSELHVAANHCETDVPAAARAAHRMVQGGVLIPIHWATALS